MFKGLVDPNVVPVWAVASEVVSMDSVVATETVDGLAWHLTFASNKQALEPYPVPDVLLVHPVYLNYK